MICCTRPRTQKKKLRKQWLMPQGLPMNLEQNKNMLHPKKKLSELWIAKLSNFKESWKKQMTLLSKEAVLQWPNSKQELENYNSNKMKSRRIKKG